ncbi:MAG: hypothetical protein AB1611_12320 [bacterium]
MEMIEFNLLKAEIEAQVKEIERIYNEVEDRERGAQASKAKLESLGYQLHNLYCAFEYLFKIVACCFENRILGMLSKDSTQCKVLLRRITLSVEGLRPPLISNEAYRELDELRAFRYFFRHAYSYELRYEKVKIPLDSARRLKGLYQKDIAQFLDTVEKEIDRPSCD